MPAGYPKDPAAHAEKMAALSRERSAAKVANGGQPVKRTYYKKVVHHKTTPPTQTVTTVERKPRKPATMKVTQKGTGRTATVSERSTAILVGKLTRELAERDKTIQELSTELKEALLKGDRLAGGLADSEGKLSESNATIQNLENLLDVAQARVEVLERQMLRLDSDLRELNDTIDEVAAQTRLVYRRSRRANSGPLA